MWGVFDFLAASTQEHFAASFVSGYFWSPVEQAEAVLWSAGQSAQFRSIYTKNLKDPSPLLLQIAGIPSSPEGPRNTKIDLWDFRRETMRQNLVSLCYLQNLEAMVSCRLT